ncbi:gamma-glutamyltransferase family protein [Pelagibacteraceae bacterium]|nr:gamma-glutamyltransferase family protein [Pelagibacteraceae bacterium]
MRQLSFPGRSNVLGQNGMAATSNPLSSIEAINILKKGGNAVDAAIAASAVQSVVCPSATGIGGDCFAIISLNGKDPIAINGSGIAPKKANLEYFIKNKIKKIGLTSPHSVTIPGAVHAWCSMHEKYGKLELEEILQGAINYAQNGFPIHEVEAQSWKEKEDKLKENKNTKMLFLKNNKSYKFGEIFKNIPLANTLKLISKKKIDGFYNSEITRDMVSSLNQIGGLHTEEDFFSQETIFSSTISNFYNNYKIHQCPLNGPGIIVLLMMALNEKLKTKQYDKLSFERYHLQAEITKVCFEVKETILGDPSFNNINIEKILNEEMLENLSSKISLETVYRSKKAYVTSNPETIYLTVVDKDLNTISFINSICHSFGSCITTNKSGILFQNRGVNFRLEKNHPNVIQGNKRPLHTIIPGLITNEKNEAIISYGVMGGQYQPIGQSHVLQNIIDYNQTIQEALDLPRAFALNNELKIEKSLNYEIVNKLDSIGHNISIVEHAIGGGQCIKIDRENGVLIAGSDPRKDGMAIGY